MDETKDRPRTRAAASPGRVTLVGAGPGGADLLTVRGARALAQADVVVHDRLVDPEILDLAPPNARRIGVGKSKGRGVSQGEINRILVEEAAAGAHVVRLKGGDPYVFGRGGEEVDAVTAAGFEVTVVPGVSSALAAPALAGVPVTHRGLSTSVLILSGHRAGSEDYDWAAVARAADTLVFLMAASTASLVAQQLLEAGRPGDDPVVIITRAGSSQQSVSSCDLSALHSREEPLPSPSVLVIGRVAARATSRSNDGNS